MFFNAEARRRRERRGDFRAGALPQTPIDVESQAISSHSGYGVNPISKSTSASLRLCVENMTRIYNAETRRVWGRFQRRGAEAQRAQRGFLELGRRAFGMMIRRVKL